MHVYTCVRSVIVEVVVPLAQRVRSESEEVASTEHEVIPNGKHVES